MSWAPPAATANRPEPGVAQVMVTPAVRMVSSCVRPIIPWMAMTAPGAAVATALRRPASLLPVTVGVAGQGPGPPPGPGVRAGGPAGRAPAARVAGPPPPNGASGPTPFAPTIASP